MARKEFLCPWCRLPVWPEGDAVRSGGSFYHGICYAELCREAERTTAHTESPEVQTILRGLAAVVRGAAGMVGLERTRAAALAALAEAERDGLAPEKTEGTGDGRDR
jgi:hypothetical protein